MRGAASQRAWSRVLGALALALALSACGTDEVRGTEPAPARVPASAPLLAPACEFVETRVAPPALESDRWASSDGAYGYVFDASGSVAASNPLGETKTGSWSLGPDGDRVVVRYDDGSGALFRQEARCDGATRLVGYDFGAALVLDGAGEFAPAPSR